MKTQVRYITLYNKLIQLSWLARKKKLITEVENHTDCTLLVQNFKFLYPDKFENVQRLSP
jgi:hypothetical protein